MKHTVAEINVRQPDEQHIRGTGTFTTVNWKAVEAMMQKEGLLHPNEVIDGVRVTRHGIEVKIEKVG